MTIRIRLALLCAVVCGQPSLEINDARAAGIPAGHINTGHIATGHGAHGFHHGGHNINANVFSTQVVGLTPAPGRFSMICNSVGSGLGLGLTDGRAPLCRTVACGFGGGNCGFGCGNGSWANGCGGCGNWGCGSWGCGNWGWGGGYYGCSYGDCDNTVPYYSLHPPVYYSFPVPRTYGYSPFPYPDYVMTPPLAEEVGPATIVNPFVPKSDEKAPAPKPGSEAPKVKPTGALNETADDFSTSASSKTIVNPFVTTELAAETGR